VSREKTFLAACLAEQVRAADVATRARIDLQVRLLAAEAKLAAGGNRHAIELANSLRPAAKLAIASRSELKR
jgi:hypothetical protein